MKKFIVILVLFSFLGFQLTGCAFMSQTENRQAVGAASGGILGLIIGGNALGAIVGAFAGTIVVPVGGYFYDKLVAPRAKAVKKYGFRAEEEILEIEESLIVPQNVAPGSTVEADVQYTVLAPVDTWQLKITETRMLAKRNEGLIELAKREVFKTQGTHISKFKFTIPKEISKGDYTLITTISNGKQTRTVISAMKII